MESLRRRAALQIAALAEELRGQLAARLLSPSALQGALLRFVFRDRHGEAWALGPLTNVWYLHQNGRWVASPTPPPEALDGFADLGLMEHADSTQFSSLAGLALDGSQPQGAPDPAAYFRDFATRVVRAYEDGSISSDSAEARLRDIYAMDPGGTAWMLGVQSESWYTYSGAGWQRAPRALKANTLQGDPGPSAAENIRTFLQRSTAFIPEPIVAAWTPPADSPERILTCPNCSALNVGEVGSCISCGRPLAGSLSAAATASSVEAAAPPSPKVVDQLTPQTQTPPASTVPAAPSKPRSRLWWFIGGGCCLASVCIVIVSMLIVGRGLLPTSVVSAPASQPAPSLGPAPTASNMLLEDSFEDANRTAVPLFGPDAMEFQIEAADGVGVMTAHVPGALIATYDSPAAADFVATLKLVVPAAAPGAGYGMVFRSDDAAGGLTHYYILLASPADQYVSLARWGSDGYVELRRADFLAKPGGTLELMVRAQGSRFEVELDGQSLFRVEDDALPGSGIFGLALYGTADGDRVIFQDFRVEALGD